MEDGALPPPPLGWSLRTEGGLCVNVETKRNEVGFCEEMWVCGKLTGVPV